MTRTPLKLVLVGSFLALTLVAGCSSRVGRGGGATGPKAEQARAKAEGLAGDVVTAVAKAQAKAVPELSRSHPGEQSIAITPQVPPQPAPVAPPAATSPSTFPNPLPMPPGQFPAPPPMPSPVVKAPTSAEVPVPTKSGSRSSVVIREHVSSSILFPSEVEAENDALTVASPAIERRLASLDPPVKYQPTVNEIRNEFARKESRTVRRPSEAELGAYAKYSGKDINELGNLVYVDYDIEVTARQVRELRSQGRISLAAKVCGSLVFASLAVFLFLRLDEWTKGYLTRWLAGAAILLVGGGAAALYFL